MRMVNNSIKVEVLQINKYRMRFIKASTIEWEWSIIPWGRSCRYCRGGRKKTIKVAQTVTMRTSQTKQLNKKTQDDKSSFKKEVLFARQVVRGKGKCQKWSQRGRWGSDQYWSSQPNPPKGTHSAADPSFAHSWIRRFTSNAAYGRWTPVHVGPEWGLGGCMKA